MAQVPPGAIGLPGWSLYDLNKVVYICFESYHTAQNFGVNTEIIRLSYLCGSLSTCRRVACQFHPFVRTLWLR